MALETKNAIISDLGGADQLSTLETIAAEHAALAACVVQDSYAKWLQGKDVPLAELGVVQNCFLRVASVLGFRRRAKDMTKTIDEYLSASEPMSSDAEIKEG